MICLPTGVPVPAVERCGPPEWTARAPRGPCRCAPPDEDFSGAVRGAAHAAPVGVELGRAAHRTDLGGGARPEPAAHRRPRRGLRGAGDLGGAVRRRAEDGDETVLAHALVRLPP